MRMTVRPFRRLLPIVAAVLLAACGRHGAKVTPATPAPTATPALAPGCTALAPQTLAGSSAYTLTSNPSGLAVQRVDPTKTTCTYFTGTTTATDTPQNAPHPWNYVFAPAAASPFTVSVAQEFNGNHTLLYNQAGDSTGSIVASSLQSVRRTTAATRSVNELQRGIRRFSGAGVDANMVLVRYRGAAAQMRARSQQIAMTEGTTNGTEITTAGGTYERFVRVPAATDATAFAAKLRTQSDVADVYPVHNRKPLGRPATTVNDQHANNVDQWYLFADGFPNAWSYNLGAGAKIAIIDTGVDLNNTDLSAKIDFSKGYKTTTAQDTNGHGTNVSGIAGSLTNNTTGFAGAGYNVRLFVYNIFPDTTASSDAQFASVADEVSAINDAVTRGADVLSLSLGAAQDTGTDFNSAGFDQGEHDAIEAAITAGVVVVAAAGNDADGGESGTPHSVLDYPAAYDNVIAVGATGLHDTANPGSFTGATEAVTSYSQSGPGLGVVAPGGDATGSDTSPLHWIWNYSTSTANFGSGPGNGDKCSTPSPPTSCTALFEGTSQATPQVSAAAALLISAAGGHHALTPARVTQLIEDTADNIGDPRQGHGRLNVYKAIALLFNDTGTYSGPTPQKTSPAQTVAFAYANSGSNKPVILDVDYPAGVPLDASGAFRIGDVPAAAGNYRVAVWYDANGDGVVNASDQFGVSAATCNSGSKCTIGSITMSAVTAGFVLP
jgi:uncharacterized protein (DUF2141 family)